MTAKTTFDRTGLLLVIALIGSFLVFTCGDDDDDPPTTPGEAARVEGRVTDGEGFNTQVKSGSIASANVEGADVILARVESDGSLNTVSTDTAQTDSAGAFLIETDVDRESRLVVVATKDSAEWRAVVSDEVRQGTVVSCQPLNNETTLEADVYATFVENGDADAVSYTDIATNIDDEVAAMLKGDAAGVTTLSTALESEAAAHNGLLTDASIGGTEAQLGSIAMARSEAQVTLEAALLNAGDNQTAIEAAFAEFREADLNAYLESGLTVTSYAQAREASAKGLTQNATSLSPEAQFALSRRSAAVRSFVLSRAAQENFTELGATQDQMTAVIDAGTTLETSIETATTQQQLTAAFQGYHDAIVTQLQAVAGTNAAAILTVDTSINAAAGAKSILASAVSAATATQAIVGAYVTFFGAVETLAETSLTGADAARVEAISNVLILINMQV